MGRDGVEPDKSKDLAERHAFSGAYGQHPERRTKPERKKNVRRTKSTLAVEKNLGEEIGAPK